MGSLAQAQGTGGLLMGRWVDPRFIFPGFCGFVDGLGASAFCSKSSDLPDG